MSIEYYIFIYTLLLSIILFSKVIRLKEYYVMILFSFVYLSNAFRIDSINDDAINYLFYFTDVSLYNDFESLLYSFDWIKIEIGFKALLYTISNINIFDSSLTYKFAISTINVLIFYYLFIVSKLKNNNNYVLFIFLYICSFLFIFDFAIIRFSISVLLLLVLFHKIIYTKYTKLTILFLYIIASSFHIAAMIFGFVFIYYYYYIIKKNYNKFFIFLPFIIVLIIVPLLMKFASIFGSYYSSMFSESNSRVSIRIVVELIFIGYTYYYMRYTDSKKIFKLLFILYLFFAFVEIYLGIMVLNRLRIIIWLFFLYSITFVWNETKIIFKINLISYSLIFYFIQIINISNSLE